MKTDKLPSNVQKRAMETFFVLIKKNIYRGKNINQAEKDKMVWKVSKDGSYTVKSNMDVFEQGRGVVSFPKRLVWNQFVPTKVGFLFEKCGGAR